jgi:hypothetical protein
MAAATNSPLDLMRFGLFSFLVLLNTLIVVVAVYGGHTDFRVFYATGSLVRQGDGALIYSAEQQARSQAVEPGEEPLPFYHPAYEALIFVPLSLLTYKYALIAWALLNVGLVLFVCLTARVSLVGCLAFAPIAFTIMLGQDALLSAAIIAVGFRMLHSGRDELAGASLALALFRFHLIVPLVGLLALAGRKRVLWGFLPSCVALVIVSVLVTGPGSALDYVRIMTSLAQGVAGYDVHRLSNMPTIRGLASLAGGRLSVVLWVAVSAIVFWKGIAATREQPESAIVFGLLLAPYGYVYELTPVVLLMKHRMTWPFVLLAFTPLYLVLGSWLVVSLMTLPLAALLLVGEQRAGLRLPALRKARSASPEGEAYSLTNGPSTQV